MKSLIAASQAQKSLPDFDEHFVDHRVGAFHHATGRDLPRVAALKLFEAMQRRSVFRELLASLTAHPEWTLADAYTDYRRRIAADSGYVRTLHIIENVSADLLRSTSIKARTGLIACMQ